MMVAISVGPLKMLLQKVSSSCLDLPRALILAFGVVDLGQPLPQQKLAPLELEQQVD